MNTLTKVVLVLVAILVIAVGAYVLLGDMSPVMSDIPTATESVDDFAAAMEAELSAGAAAIKAFDTGVDASVSSVTTAADASTLYDPNNI